MIMQHKIYNEDGSFIIRDYTKEEEAQQVKYTAEYEQKLAAEAKAATDKAALLAKLGITPDEAKLLLS